MNSSVSSIKRKQKASLLLRTISQLFLEATMDDKEVQGLYINRVELSAGKSHAHVYFCSPGGQEEFDKKFSRLVLYKPSLRAALSKQIASRYTPEIVFKFDASAEKCNRVNALIDSLKEEDKL